MKRIKIGGGSQTPSRTPVAVGTTLLATVLLVSGCANSGNSRQAQLEAQLIAAEQEAARMAVQLRQAQMQNAAAAAPATPPPAPKTAATTAQAAAEVTATPVSAPASQVKNDPQPSKSVVFRAGHPQAVDPNAKEVAAAVAETPAPVVVPQSSPEAIAAPAEIPQPAPVAEPAPLPPPPPVAPGFAAGELPPNPQPGECYARLYTQPVYEERTETVVQKEAGERIELVPATYKSVEEQVLVRQAYEKVVEVIPPVYKTVREDVIVQAGFDRIEQVPAVYDEVEQKVLVKPAHTVWKPGRGPIEKLDTTTGEIMCLVEVPAQYKTIKKRVLVSPATTKRVSVPPQLESVEKRELVTPAQVIKETVPAEYKTVMVKKVDVPAQEKRIPVPAVLEQVTKQVLVKPGSSEWRSVLCETNTTPPVIKAIQTALKDRGFNPGKIDGVIGSETMQAAQSFQRKNKLAEGQLSMETVRALGVNLNLR